MYRQRLEYAGSVYSVQRNLCIWLLTHRGANKNNKCVTSKRHTQGSSTRSLLGTWLTQSGELFYILLTYRTRFSWGSTIALIGIKPLDKLHLLSQMWEPGTQQQWSTLIANLLKLSRMQGSSVQMCVCWLSYSLMGPWKQPRGSTEMLEKSMTPLLACFLTAVSLGLPNAYPFIQKMYNEYILGTKVLPS